MRKSRFCQEMIIACLKEANGAKIADMCRRHGVSDQTYFRWKRKYGVN